MFFKTIPAIFLQRLNRFVAEVLLEGEKILVYVPNTGSLKSVLEKNAPCYLLKNNQGKLTHTLLMIQGKDSLIGVHTQVTNKLVEEFYEGSMIKREVKILDSRLDFKVNDTWVEVKNVTWKKDSFALFPDALSLRARKHLETLYELKKRGEKVLLFFCIQREDISCFKPAEEIDLFYSQRMKELSSEIPIKAYKCRLNSNEIKISEEVSIQF